MITLLIAFLLSVQTLTLFPIRANLKPTKELYACSTYFYPIVGLLIGIVNFLLYLVLEPLKSNNITAIILLACNFFITGGFHLDGLADSFDAFFSSRSKEQMLEILKDSRIGVFGAAGIVFDLLARYVCYVELLHHTMGVALILFPIIGRSAITVISYRSHYARENGLGQVIIGNTPLGSVIFSFIFSLVLGVFFFKFTGLLICLLSFCVALIIKKYAQHKIGGLTGDILGLTVEASEILFLVLCILVK